MKLLPLTDSFAPISARKTATPISALVIPLFSDVFDEFLDGLFFGLVDPAPLIEVGSINELRKTLRLPLRLLLGEVTLDVTVFVIALVWFSKSIDNVTVMLVTS